MWLVPPRSLRAEILDGPDHRERDLRGALRSIDAVNRHLGGARALQDAIRPLLQESPAGRPFEVLDVGTGNAALCATMVDLGRELRRNVRVTAIDRDPAMARIAATDRAGDEAVRVVQADALRLPFRPGSFDLVTASMFLHHFPHAEIVRLLGSFRDVARRAVLINDLRRHLVPYGFIAAVARLFRTHPMFVHDAPLSVLRGFTVAELERAAAESGAPRFGVQRRWPYRLMLTIRPESP